MAATTLTIGELAAAVALRPSALRYYEELGLVEPVGRDGGRRIYSPDAVARLKLVRFCVSLGFTLRETAQLLNDDGAGWQSLVDAKLAEVEATLDGAQRMRGLLLECRACGCVTPATCEALAHQLA